MARLKPSNAPWLVSFARLLALAAAASVIVPAAGLLSRQARYGLIERVNEAGPYIGLVMADKNEEAALLDSGAFTPKPDFPVLQLYGRRFHVGDVSGVRVIYVRCGERRLNAGVSVQILLDAFEVIGIVHYGTAGSANDSLTVGSVSVPKFFAFTGSWSWTRTHYRGGVPEPELEFGAFNVPVEGDNLLGKVLFGTEEFFPLNGNGTEDVFWLELNGSWIKMAEQLKDFVLEKCTNETACGSEDPKVVVGLKASTADTFVDNPSYREFLFQTFGVATVDEESAAIVMTAMSGGVPVIVFRGVSDLARGASTATKQGSASTSSLASVNAVKVSTEFMRLIGNHNNLLPS